MKCVDCQVEMMIEARTKSWWKGKCTEFFLKINVILFINDINFVRKLKLINLMKRYRGYAKHEYEDSYLF